MIQFWTIVVNTSKCLGHKECIISRIVALIMFKFGFKESREDNIMKRGI